MVDDIKGWIYTNGMDISPSIDPIVLRTGGLLGDNRIHKFPEDEILKEREEKIYFFDGYIVNKKELNEKNQAVTWEETFIKTAEKDSFLEEFRGAFCGFVKNGQKYTLFSDHVGNRAMYYYYVNGKLIISNRFYYILETLKFNNIEVTYNEQAAKYMLVQGFMLDETTFANEIYRVLPGQKIYLEQNEVRAKRYYILDNEHIRENLSESEAIELIDEYFRKAVRREFEKDKEYGYQHLVDLSGGLDSRMVTWVAHDLGYTDQVNFTYCRSNYLDFKIAQKISLYLKHIFCFMPLDDFKWFYEIDEILKKNNGGALYSGITGGNRFLKMLNCDKFGIEHTGMIGDAVVGVFFNDKRYTYSLPEGNENVYSARLKIDIPKDVLKEYNNKEIFAFETRGLLGAQSSYMIRQNYLETCSPFLDVDFLNAVFSIPHELRKDHYIYLKWIEKKYPLAGKFGWEKWYGIRPAVSKRLMAKGMNFFYWKIVDRIFKIINKGNCHNMNPLDYWYEKDAEGKVWAEKYVEEKMEYISSFPEIRKYVSEMFYKGSVSEKTQALTVVGMAEMICK